MKLLLCLICVCFTTQVNKLSAQPINAISTLIPNLVDSGNSGAFVDILKEVGNRENIQISVNLLPPIRLVKKFVEGNHLIAFPFLESEINQETKTLGVKSIPIFYKKDYLISLKSKPVKIEKLYHNKWDIGLVRGYPYDNIVTRNENFKFLYAKNDIISIKQLIKKRVDAIVMDIAVFKKLQDAFPSFKDIAFHISTTHISKEPAFFVYQNTINGRITAKNHNIVLKKMIKDGSFSRIYKKYGFPDTAWQ